MDILKIMQNELDCQVNMADYFRQALNNMPPGKLYLKRRSTGQISFYMKFPGDTKQHYLSGKKSKLIESLKHKRFMEEAVKTATHNTSCIRNFLSSYTPNDYLSIASKLPAGFMGSTLLNSSMPYSNRDDHHLLFTQSENPYHPEHLLHHTSFGLIVRSKSEAMIADVLYASDLSLHYEKELILRDSYGQLTTVYPDFTIPLSHGRTLYWEHAGRLGEPEYRARHERKMHLYFINNIYEPKNLIVTCDGPKQEFNLRDIYRIAEKIKNM
ncbi:MAG: hypothetical protein IKW01_00210 [Firmicutes bacterium]|nr:hypothetical protein [Bacillota bacterium]